MSGAQYTVKQVADLTGVAPATLRAWERRYGVVAPQRSASRYRLYDDTDVSRLSRMAELVRAGTPASLAAARLGAVEEEATTLEEFTATPTPAVDDLVQVAQTFDQHHLTRVLDAAMARTSFETALEEWLMPALTGLGRAWERGEVDVAGEHFVSAGVHRRLAAAYDAAGPNHGAPVVLVGTPPGALHQLGALSFAVCLRRQGIDVRFLGTDVPLASWAHSVAATRPAAVVLSVPMPHDAASAAELLEQLGRDHPDVSVWVGGHGAARLDAQHQLRASAVGAARDVAEALRRR